jgi:hypothetical protein
LIFYAFADFSFDLEAPLAAKRAAGDGGGVKKDEEARKDEEGKEVKGGLRTFLLSFSLVFFFFVQERHRHSIARQRPQDLESRIGVEERIFADGGSTSTPGRRKTRERKETVSQRLRRRSRCRRCSR